MKSVQNIVKSPSKILKMISKWGCRAPTPDFGKSGSPISTIELDWLCSLISTSSDSPDSYCGQLIGSCITHPPLTLISRPSASPNSQCGQLIVIKASWFMAQKKGPCRHALPFRFSTLWVFVNFWPVCVNSYNGSFL